MKQINMLHAIFDRKLRKSKSRVDTTLQFSSYQKNHRTTSAKEKKKFSFAEPRIHSIYSLCIALVSPCFLPDHSSLLKFPDSPSLIPSSGKTPLY